MHAILFSFLLFLSVYLRLCLSFHLTFCISLRLFLCVFFHMFPASLSVPLSVSAFHCLSICIHLSPLCSLSLSLRLSHVACISCCVCHLTHALTARFTNDAAQYESWNNDNNSDRNNTRQLQPSYLHLSIININTCKYNHNQHSKYRPRTMCSSQGAQRIPSTDVQRRTERQTKG